jgi:hypothetical protein
VRVFFVLMCVAFCVGGKTYARHRHPRASQRVILAPECNVSMPCDVGNYSVFKASVERDHPSTKRRKRRDVPVSHRRRSREVEHSSSSEGGRPPGCPHAWCGCFLAAKKGLHDPRLYVARNWATLYGSPTSPQPGAVVVWNHHVGELVEHIKGNIWMVLSGNDGHAVRARPRSISGAIAFRI